MMKHDEAGVSSKHGRIIQRYSKDIIPCRSKAKSSSTAKHRIASCLRVRIIMFGPPMFGHKIPPFLFQSHGFFPGPQGPGAGAFPASGHQLRPWSTVQNLASS